MKCVECEAISTILVENDDGTVTPMCDQCYHSPRFTPDEISQGLRNIANKAINSDKK